MHELKWWNETERERKRIEEESNYATIFRTWCTHSNGGDVRISVSKSEHVSIDIFSGWVQRRHLINRNRLCRIETNYPDEQTKRNSKKKTHTFQIDAVKSTDNIGFIVAVCKVTKLYQVLIAGTEKSQTPTVWNALSLASATDSNYYVNKIKNSIYECDSRVMAVW